VTRTRCLTCKSNNLTKIIDLGMHPMADTFIKETSYGDADKVYPLICDLCENCYQIQLRTITNPDERYVQTEYSYTSSNSPNSRNHWEQYAAKTCIDLKLKPGSTIVEIGSNDGFLLSKYQEKGFFCVGIDPSEAMKNVAMQRGVQTELQYFTQKSARQLIAKLNEKPLLIVANNVFNHSNDPLDFALGISTLLHHDGMFIFELPYWLRTIQDGKFDQIYHEHVSYFTVSFAVNLFNRANMDVINVEYNDYHGGSIRVWVAHKQSHKISPSIAEAISAEMSAALFKPRTYQIFMEELMRRRDFFLETIYKLRQDGKRFICAGAAAKGNTFLNFYRLDRSAVDYVTDSSPHKIGKYTPLSRIQIVDDNIVKSYDEVYAIILSWNLFFAISSKLKEHNPNITILNPYLS